MNKTVYWAAGVLLVAGLAGCSAGNTSDIQPFVGEAPSPEPTALVAEPEITDAEKAFIESMRFIPGLAEIDEADAIAVGELVCEQLRAGTSPLEIVAVENTEPINNRDAIDVSTWTFCPEMTEQVSEVWRSAPLQ